VKLQPIVQSLVSRKDTNTKSQNSIMCYRLWASIKELIDIDEGKTPVQDCTVEMRGQNKGLQQGSKSIISGFKLPLLGLLISLKWVFKVLKGFQDISSNLWFS
jgi:hypothetical protein